MFADAPMWAAWRREGERLVVVGRRGVVRAPSYDDLGTLAEAVQWASGLAIYLDWHIGLSVVNVPSEREDALRALLRAFPSYAERSPSARSYNVFFFVDDLNVKAPSLSSIRFFDDKRFIPISGDAIAIVNDAIVSIPVHQAPDVAKPNPIALFALLARLQ